jgi:hypothetical protein
VEVDHGSWVCRREKAPRVDSGIQSRALVGQWRAKGQTQSSPGIARTSLGWPGTACDGLQQAGISLSTSLHYAVFLLVAVEQADRRACRRYNPGKNEGGRVPGTHATCTLKHCPRR